MREVPLHSAYTVQGSPCTPEHTTLRPRRPLQRAPKIKKGGRERERERALTPQGYLAHKKQADHRDPLLIRTPQGYLAHKKHQIALTSGASSSGIPDELDETRDTPSCAGRGLGFRVQGAGCRVQGSGCRVQGSGFRVQGSGFKVPAPRTSLTRRATPHPAQGGVV